MRHATSDDLIALAGFLSEVRLFTDLREKKNGVFYRKSRAFFHIHIDQGHLYGDVRLSEEFERFPLDTAAEQRRVLALLRHTLT